MQDNLIEGINPLTISKIRWIKGKRHGIHPFTAKYLKKKNPIRGFFGAYAHGLFDGFWEPCVRIYGSDGDIVREITCRSNIHAESLNDELNEKLNKFLSSIRMDQ